jgi:hypothetical protein
MFDLIGKVHGDTINKKVGKLRVSAGVTFSWISRNFKTIVCNRHKQNGIRAFSSRPGYMAGVFFSFCPAMLLSLFLEMKKELGSASC